MRKSTFYVHNIVGMMVLLSCLGFIVYCFDFNEIDTRIQTVLTILLTAVTFKFAVGESIPKVPFHTYIDKFLLMILVELSVTTFTCAIPKTALNLNIITTAEQAQALDITLFIALVIITWSSIFLWSLKALKILRTTGKIVVMDPKADCYQFRFSNVYFLPKYIPSKSPPTDPTTGLVIRAIPSTQNKDPVAHDGDSTWDNPICDKNADGGGGEGRIKNLMECPNLPSVLAVPRDIIKSLRALEDIILKEVHKDTPVSMSSTSTVDDAPPQDTTDVDPSSPSAADSCQTCLSPQPLHPLRPRLFLFHAFVNTLLMVRLLVRVFIQALPKRPLNLVQSLCLALLVLAALFSSTVRLQLLFFIAMCVPALLWITLGFLLFDREDIINILAFGWSRVTTDVFISLLHFWYTRSI